MSSIFFDRSRRECDLACRRRRWWNYEFESQGLEGDKLSYPLKTGSAVHSGIEGILANGEDTDAAIQRCVADYLRLLEIAGLCDAGGAPVPRALEQLWLTEQLIRLAAGVLLPRVLAEYQVEAVERPANWMLDYEGRQLTFMTRSDAYGPRKSDGALFVHNWKTAKVLDDKWIKKWRRDQQTLTEAAALEAVLGKTVHGTIIHGLAKGVELEYPKGSGQWSHNSPLTQLWYREADLITGTEADYVDLQHYEYTCSEPHRMNNGRQCKGGANHKLGSGYRKRFVAEVYPGGLAAWYKTLDSENHRVLESQVLSVEPILRSEYEVEKWKRQVLPREVEIAEHREECQSDEAALDRWFPQSTGNGNCDFCEFSKLCWENGGYDPLAAGYRLRTPNHQLERDRLAWETIA